MALDTTLSGCPRIRRVHGRFPIRHHHCRSQERSGCRLETVPAVLFAIDAVHDAAFDDLGDALYELGELHRAILLFKKMKQKFRPAWIDISICLLSHCRRRLCTPHLCHKKEK